MRTLFCQDQNENVYDKRKSMKILAVTVEDLPAVLALQKQAFESEARLVGSYEIPPMTQTLADLEQELLHASCSRP